MNIISFDQIVENFVLQGEHTLQERDLVAQQRAEQRAAAELAAQEARCQLFLDAVRAALPNWAVEYLPTVGKQVQRATEYVELSLPAELTAIRIYWCRSQIYFETPNPHLDQGWDDLNWYVKLGWHCNPYAHEIEALEQSLSVALAQAARAHALVVEYTLEADRRNMERLTRPERS